jgi:acetyltransferase-like isoleucine patch superfamily enzyme
MSNTFDTPWKLANRLWSCLIHPYVRFVFALNDIPWGQDWRFYGVPIIQKHRRSSMRFGSYFSLRSSVRSNPLGPNHPVILCTWQAGAVLEIGSDFAMTAGTICAAQSIIIGDRVAIGANSTVVDTDFHPLSPESRRLHPQDARTEPIVIEDDVFVGMNCLVLKGVTIGRGSVIGAGSVVTRDVPAGVVVAGNPARVIRELLEG